MDYIYCLFLRPAPPHCWARAKGIIPFVSTFLRDSGSGFIEYWALDVAREESEKNYKHDIAPISLILSEIIYEMVLWWNNQIVRA